MHFLLVRRRLVCWIAMLGLMLLDSNRANGQTDVQDWLSSLSSLVESYDNLLSQVALEKVPAIDAELAAAFDDLDRQHEEARIDCLANRLLAEEYQPYDFDIRETMWCKGLVGHSGISFEFAESPAIDPQLEIESPGVETLADVVAKTKESPNPVLWIPEFQWFNTIRAHVWSGFMARIHSNWDSLLAHSDFVAGNLQAAVSAIEIQRIENRIAATPSLRGIFGRNALPYEVGITAEEYTMLTIQLWKTLQANAQEGSILSGSSWYHLRATALEPISDLVTWIPRLFPVVHR